MLFLPRNSTFTQFFLSTWAEELHNLGVEGFQNVHFFDIFLHEWMTLPWTAGVDYSGQRYLHFKDPDVPDVAGLNTRDDVERDRLAHIIL